MNFGKKRSFIRKIVFYLLTILIPNYVTFNYTIPQFKQFNKSILLRIPILEMIKKNNIIFIILLSILIFGIPLLIFLLDNKIVKDLQLHHIKIMSELLTSIGAIVLEKRKRFYNYLEKYKNNMKSQKIFESITQPECQIAEIFKEIIAAFRKICNDDSIKGAIIYCEKNILVNFFIQSDEVSSINVEELNKKKSSAKISLQNKQIVLLSSTDQNKDNFYKTDGTKIKSIICYPIKKGNDVHFIISLTSKEKNSFKENQKGIYDFLLTQYSDRILLEYYLYEIKNKAC